MITKRAHEQLQGVFEALLDIGFAAVRPNQILAWFSQERMSKGIWKDIQQEWEDFLVEQKQKPEEIPLVIGDSGEMFVFIWGEKLSFPDTYEFWLTDCRKMPKAK
ncbi:MAG: hypothetical protein WBB98_12015 [Xanthobacteraceae bacterium]